MNNMKKLLITISVIGLLSSCGTDKQLLTEKEMTDFTVKGDTILYKETPVAVYTHWEYEINPGHGKNPKPIIELCIKQFGVPPMTDDILKFVHTKHPKVKVQVSAPREFRNATH
jgi:hypothetical protein